MLPSCAAANTKPKQRTPKPIAKNLEMFVARASFIPLQQNGRTKSSRQMAAKEFSPLDTVLHCEIVYGSIYLGIYFAIDFYLNAPLKIPATKSPGIPGRCPKVSITNNGKSWSGLLTYLGICIHRRLNITINKDW